MAKQSDDNRTMPSHSGLNDAARAAHSSASELLELHQIYALIDSILPFEACLYYQVAPLSLDGSCLVMGMVDPDDDAAAEYVTRQLSYINYSIRFQSIDSDWHRELLSKYLKYTAQPNPQSPASRLTASSVSPAESAASPAAIAETDTTTVPSQPAIAADEPSVVSEAVDPPQSPAATEPADVSPAQPAAAAKFAPPSPIDDDQLQATLILDQIEELTATMPRDLTSQYANEAVDEAEPAAKAGTETIEAEASPPSAQPAPPVTPPQEESVPIVSEAVDPVPEVAAPPIPAPAKASAPPPPPSPAVSDDVPDSEEIGRLLCALPPKVLMQALLDKVIGDGIGRLYFKREAAANRILWSRNGVLEGLIEPVEGQVLQAVIDEFKQLTHTPLAPVAASTQVEIERTHHGQRVLLRLQIMPGDNGEQATLQVLRGAALQFHQQQQIDRLEKDALDAAQMLQKRLNDIRDRARNSLDKQQKRSTALPTLIKLLKQLEAQVHEIEAAYDDE